jgi:hypothetical protein
MMSKAHSFQSDFNSVEIGSPDENIDVRSIANCSLVDTCDPRRNCNITGNSVRNIRVSQCGSCVQSSFSDRFDSFNYPLP